jgi:hypothetical protein
METNTYDKDKALRIVMRKMAEQAEQVKLSEDFTDRLMERIRQEERARKMTLRRRRIGFAVGIAAAMALLVGVALHVMHKDDEIPQLAEVKRMKAEVSGERDKVREVKKVDVPEAKVDRLLAYASSPINHIVHEEEMVEGTKEDEPLVPEVLFPEATADDQDVCWILIPNTPFALRYSLTWESGDEGAAKANVSAVECVTIEENDTVLIKSPSGEISKGSMYVYEGEKKENDFVYVQDGRLLTADVRIYYKKAFLNADGQTYSYIDALALLDYPTCSLCMKD